MLTVIDVFCGAGGFSEGFRQQGFKIVHGIDVWKPAIDTYNHSFSLDCKTQSVLDFKDIDKIHNLPNTDVILGSPPCVSFSSSNNSGKADKKIGILLTKLFFKIVAVKKYQKDSTLKAWYMENVKNSIKHTPDKYTFKKLGLKVWAEENGYDPLMIAIDLDDSQTLINSADYGSAQKRIRAISGEIVKAKKLVIPKKTHFQSPSSKEKKYVTLGDIRKKLPRANLRKNSRKIIIDPQYNQIKLPINKLTDHFYDSGIYEAHWRQSEYFKVNHPYMGKMAFPEHEDKPSRTITATRSTSSRESIIYKSEYNRIGNGEYRLPTVRETAILMGFPITYQFMGKLNSKWRLVGNAVCPTVSRALAKSLLNYLNLPVKNKPIVCKDVNLNNVINLNTFEQVKFNNTPLRKANSRFRRHPVKDGNLTVTLSNYKIENNSASGAKWYSSIQYGTGSGFPIQNVRDGYYRKIEAYLAKYHCGKQFIHTINNGFSEMIGASSQLQTMYEQNKPIGNYLEPTLLVEKVGELLNDIDFKEEYFEQKKVKIFKNKEVVPSKQLFALYAINKISTLANKK